MYVNDGTMAQSRCGISLENLVGISRGRVKVVRCR